MSRNIRRKDQEEVYCCNADYGTGRHDADRLRQHATNTTTDDSAAKDNTAATDTAADFKLATDGKLTMATNAYFEPWEYYDGENIVGIDPGGCAGNRGQARP